MILDCCYSAKAFTQEHIGKRKFELLTSAAHNLKSPAPKYPHSFTGALHATMTRLIQENPKGFCTSHLYRELYHALPDNTNPKPLLFDQARHSFGRIWLRPQVQPDNVPKSEDGGRYLKLTFRLNETPNLAVMNELALHLQYLPHVDQVRFDDLYAPKAQIADFMKMVIQASKLKPLMRKIHARRQLRKQLSEQQHQETPTSLLKLRLGQTSHPVYDWGSASRDPHYTPVDSQHTQDRMKKSGTWPPPQGKSPTDRYLSNGPPTSTAKINEVLDQIPDDVYIVPSNGRHKRSRSVSPPRGLPPAKSQRVDH